MKKILKYLAGAIVIILSLAWMLTIGLAAVVIGGVVIVLLLAVDSGRRV
jgi:hypothetical protein